MTTEQELLERIRRLIASGALPAVPPGPAERLPGPDRQGHAIDEAPAEACLICLRQRPDCSYPHGDRPIRVHAGCAELWIKHGASARRPSRE
jgi:hypothetical protein